MFKKAFAYYTKAFFSLPHTVLYKIAYNKIRTTITNTKQQTCLNTVGDLTSLKNKCLITAVLYFTITFILIFNAYCMAFKSFDSLTKISSCTMLFVSLCTFLYGYLYVHKYNIVKDFIQCKN